VRIMVKYLRRALGRVKLEKHGPLLKMEVLHEYRMFSTIIERLRSNDRHDDCWTTKGANPSVGFRK